MDEAMQEGWDSVDEAIEGIVNKMEELNEGLVSKIQTLMQKLGTITLATQKFAEQTENTSR
jgi:prefoldin subunit 5